jgi:hypothetical protein
MFVAVYLGQYAIVVGLQGLWQVRPALGGVIQGAGANFGKCP